MNSILAIAKAMSDPNRLRVLCALRDRELCACDLIALLGLAQATVSRHLNLLVQAGLILGRKDGRWMHYRLPGRTARPEVRAALAWVHAHAGRSHQAGQDQARIRARLNQVRAKPQPQGACGPADPTPRHQARPDKPCRPLRRKTPVRKKGTV